MFEKISKKSLAAIAAKKAREKGKKGMTTEGMLYYLEILNETSREILEKNPASEIVLDNRAGFVLRKKNPGKRIQAEIDKAQHQEEKSKSIAQIQGHLRSRRNSLEVVIGIRGRTNRPPLSEDIKQRILDYDPRDLSREELKEFKEILIHRKRVIRGSVGDEKYIRWSSFVLKTDIPSLAANLYDVSTQTSLDKYLCPRTGKYPTDKQFVNLDLENKPHKVKQLYNTDPYTGLFYINEYIENRDRWEKENPGQVIYAARVSSDLKIVPNMASSIGYRFWSPDTEESLAETKAYGYLSPEKWFYPAIIKSPECFSIIRKKIDKINEFLPLE